MKRIEECISFQVGKAAQRVSRRAKELLAPHGVTPLQYAVLKCLSETENGLSGVELGSRIVLDSASITGVVDRLVTNGLVVRKLNKDDRRVHQLYLSRKGIEQQGELDAAMDQLNEEAGYILGRSRKSFPKLLRKLGSREGWSSNV